MNVHTIEKLKEYFQPNVKTRKQEEETKNKEERGKNINSPYNRSGEA